MSSMPRSNMKLDAATIRRLSVLASVDPRTLRRELVEPGSVRSLAGHRIRAALHAEGLLLADTERATA